MNIWFTSDTHWHFGHNKKFLWEPRGFNSIEEHDRKIIENWNSVVKPEDEIYLLGDVMLNDNEHGLECINCLNGKIHIILGNHDGDSKIELYRKCKNIVSIEYATKIKYKKIYFFLCHYKVQTANYDDQLSWAKHIVSLHGHTHSKEKFEEGNPYQYNVSLDANNNIPISIDEIIENIKNKKIEMENNK